MVCFVLSLSLHLYFNLYAVIDDTVQIELTAGQKFVIIMIALLLCYIFLFCLVGYSVLCFLAV